MDKERLKRARELLDENTEMIGVETVLFFVKELIDALELAQIELVCVKKQFKLLLNEEITRVRESECVKKIKLPKDLDSLVTTFLDRFEQQPEKTESDD